MSIELRNPNISEKPACLHLLSTLSSTTESAFNGIVEDSFEKLLNKERGEIVVAVEGVAILGMATVSYNLAMRYGGEYCQLEELIVAPEARGKSIGGLLVQRTIDNATSRGCADYGLYLMETTEHNRPFYEKYGFVAIGTEMRQRLSP